MEKLVADTINYQLVINAFCPVTFIQHNDPSKQMIF